MLKGKLLKNVFPYFNKIVTATQKERSLIEVKGENNQIIFTLFENAGSSIVYTVESEGSSFKGLFFEFKDLSSAFSKIKSNDDIEIVCDNYRMTLNINEETSYVVASTLKLNCVDEEGVLICQTTDYNLLKTIEEHKVFVSRGSMDYNNNLFFKLSDDNLSIFNTNDIAMVLNTINVKNTINDNKFAIANEDVSTIYKWINAIKNLDISILLSNNFVYFKTKNESLKLSLTKINNIDTLIKGFDTFNNVELKMINEYTLSSVKKVIFEEANKIDKEDNLLILSNSFDKVTDNNIIGLDKRLFLNIIKAVCDDSKIGVLDNELNPIIITHNEEGLTHKIIFNTITNKRGI